MRILVVLLLVLAGCTLTGNEPTTLTVLASSELADLTPVLEDLRRDTGVELKLDTKGTVQASDDLATGNAKQDLAWLSTNRYLKLRSTQLPLSTSTMMSPLVIGVKPAKARQLKHKGPPSWADVAASAGIGELRFGMADPRRSGSGLAALIGVATAAAGTGAALRPEDVKCDKLQSFLVGRRDFDAGQYPARQDEVDAVVTHESEVLSLNASGKLREQLEVIYPRDGIVLLDYPLMLLDHQKRAAYDKVADWLKSRAAQRAIMEKTFRRPLDPDMPRTGMLREPLGTALYFPGTQQVLDTLLAAYDRAGQSGKVVLALDFSASMRDARIAGLRQAFATLTGNGGFDQFRLGESVTVIRFAGQILEERTVTIGGQADLDALRDVVASGGLAGGTAIWSALDRAYQLVQDGTVVLITDGENNAGTSKEAFLAARPKLPAPTFVIRLDAANPAQLAEVTSLNGVTTVDSSTESLLEAVKQIRGCRQ
ncbi:Ca-activated chloride channel family protein [Kibdelosporangium banguiense]|uniref:Ca-activated chloride channel family protein n=1 Tax=Kibdelosporangium banguiense TaxID=1365924 RepID=A0ABS4T954_9PSEU|nr:Ca-activated chloride channel family protein [Kibdelosporangium banguiense]